MVRCDMWRRGKKKEKIFPSVWLWVIVAVTVLKTVSGISDLDALYPGSVECPNEIDARKPLQCNLQSGNSKVYRLDDFDWKNHTKIIIIGNGNQVILKEPAYRKKIMEVEIHNASKVTTMGNQGNGSFQLVLHKCTGITIDDSVDLVRLVDSEANRIILPRVSQFDLEDSVVGEVSLMVDSDKSTFKNSTIELVTKLVIRGSFIFGVEDSTLGHVKHFLYDSSMNNVMENVTVKSVLHNGFIVKNGGLTLRNFTVKNVESKGIIVLTDRFLKIEYSEIETTVPNSILINENSSLLLKNVTLGPYRDVSFTVSDPSVSLYPLKFLQKPSVVPALWITLAVLFGLVVGGSSGVGIMFFVMKRRRFMKSKMDTNELLTQEQSIPRIESGLPTNNQRFQSTPLPPTRPLPEVPRPPLPEAPKASLSEAPNRPLPEVPMGTNEEVYEQYVDVLPSGHSQAPQTGIAQRGPFALPQGDDEEVYEQYMDVLPSALNQKAPQAGIAQRAPFPFTNKSSSTPLGMKDKVSVKPKPRPIVPNRSDNACKGNHNLLPPPPPPTAMEEEEVYEELEANHSFKPPPPSKANKPFMSLSPRMPGPPTATGKFKKP